ncbi:hypothetical protein GQX73_g4992 [Xylaria multiplex]|uniref:Cyanovirin-N domain-containing protein n=1 Tax=Xylaria multiplex TaxID=323545 RepID=A0A7C8ITF5_9PEZI|nr:hypothetical protein GQX73_g4992 [Xylaria multiplex]
MSATLTTRITHALITMLGIAATASAHAAILYSHFPGPKCHCGLTKGTTVVPEEAVGVCLQISNMTDALTVDVTEDWNVFLFETDDCSDEGGWIFPEDENNATVCNYNLNSSNETLLYYTVVGPDDDRYKLGGLRGEIDQHCGTPTKSTF